MQTKTRDDLITRVILQHAHSLQVADFFYQVTYCETKYSHRHVNFEIDSDCLDDFLSAYRQFEEEIRIIDQDVALVKL